VRTSHGGNADRDIFTLRQLQLTCCASSVLARNPRIDVVLTSQLLRARLPVLITGRHWLLINKRHEFQPFDFLAPAVLHEQHRSLWRRQTRSLSLKSFLVYFQRCREAWACGGYLVPGLFLTLHQLKSYPKDVFLYCWDCGKMILLYVCFSDSTGTNLAETIVNIRLVLFFIRPHSGNTQFRNSARHRPQHLRAVLEQTCKQSVRFTSLLVFYCGVQTLRRFADFQFRGASAVFTESCQKQYIFQPVLHWLWSTG